MTLAESSEQMTVTVETGAENVRVRPSDGTAEAVLPTGPYSGCLVDCRIVSEAEGYRKIEISAAGGAVAARRVTGEVKERTPVGLIHTRRVTEPVVINASEIYAAFGANAERVAPAGEASGGAKTTEHADADNGPARAEHEADGTARAAAAQPAGSAGGGNLPRRTDLAGGDSPACAAPATEDGASAGAGSMESTGKETEDATDGGDGSGDAVVCSCLPDTAAGAGGKAAPAAGRTAARDGSGLLGLADLTSYVESLMAR